MMVMALLLCLLLISQVYGLELQLPVPGSQLVLADGTYGIESTHSVKCLEINSARCRSHLKYNFTSFPNRMAMSEMSEVEVRLADYSSIMSTKCSRFIEFFICSMYIPMCSNKMVLQPCRRFCYHVKHRCLPLINHFSYPWPADLRCENLPEAGDARGELCIHPESYDNDDAFKNQFPGKKSKLMTSHIATILRGNNKHILDRLIERESKKLTLGGTLNPGGSGATSDGTAVQCAADEVDIGGTGTNVSCLQRCHASFYFRRADRRFAEVWMAVWAGACLVSTLLTFLTFVADARQGGRRFQYPERPIVYLSICYFFYSVAFLLRAAVGGDAISCRHQTQVGRGKSQFLVRAGHEGTWCTIVFLILYFFTMAAALWWVVLCITWFLSAARRWGHEGVERVSSVFHMVAWALPAIKSIVILIMHKIDGDELTGLCFVGAQERLSLLVFVIGPLLTYLSIGSFFLLWGFCSLFTVRKDLKSESGTANVRRLEKLMAKIGVFSILYIVPAVCVVAANLYEYLERPRWQLARQLACHTTTDPAASNREEGCLATSRPSVEVYMLKNFMSIAVGITSGVWVWGNKKSLDSWRRCLGCGDTAANVKMAATQQQHAKANYRRQVAHLPVQVAPGGGASLEPDQYTYAGSSLLGTKPQTPTTLVTHKFGNNSSCV